MSNSIEISIAVVEFAGKFLIGERPQGAILAGYWEFPGGKVEPGETPSEAAARECREETGLEVLVGEEYPEVVQAYDHGQMRLHFFQAAPREFSLPTNPRFLWVLREQLGDYQFPEANHALLASLREPRQEMPRELYFWLGPAHGLTALAFAGLLVGYGRQDASTASVLAALGIALLAMTVVNKAICQDARYGVRQLYFDLTACAVTCVFSFAIGWPAFLVWIPLILLRRL